ncbi:formate dehydrogenase accessory sulfurtransferase FdhD [Bradyrhizobium elkanii]
MTCGPHACRRYPRALTYNGTTLAVVMAASADLTHLAFGFSLTEGIIAAPIRDRGPRHRPARGQRGARMWLTSDRSDRLAARRRRLVGSLRPPRDRKPGRRLFAHPTCHE